MTTGDRTSNVAQSPPDHEDMAAEVFARRRLGRWTEGDESDLQTRMGRDALFADAFHRVERSWAAVGHHSTSAEIMTLREQAISRARRASARRWRAERNGPRRVLRIAAIVAAAAVALTAVYELIPFGMKPGEFSTTVGEQRSIELVDHSRVALDATTQLRVQFSRDSRVIQLLQGQAQFSVAKDPARPFKVEVGNHTIVALGTVFTVEYTDEEIRVATLEGKVAVPVLHRSGMSTIELVAGEELRMRQNGQGEPITKEKADLEAATAWREGKVIFRSEPLGEAVRRLNRYSHQQLEIDDPSLAGMNISGVFDTGDTAAFVEAVQTYLPVAVDRRDPQTLRLRTK